MSIDLPDLLIFSKSSLNSFPLQISVIPLFSICKLKGNELSMPKRQKRDYRMARIQEMYFSKKKSKSARMHKLKLL